MDDTQGRPATIDRRSLLLGTGATALVGALTVAGAPDADAAAAAAAEASPAPAGCRQLITVNSSSSSATTATLYAWQRYADGSWRKQFGPIAARVGSLGIGKASEGSSKTPAGTFPLDVAFGRQPDPGTAMSYFKTDPLDWWDCNPASPTYNMHVRRSTSPGGNSEHLYYIGAVYDYAVNINHNPRRVPGAGSAIFLHVTDGGPTAGCVSIDRSALVSILRWLNPAQHPYASMRVGSAWTPPRVPLGQAQSYVEQLYRTVLAVSPTAARVAPWANAVRLGADRRYVADRFGISDARYRLITHRGYLAVLGRKADAAGLRTWTARFAGGDGVDELMIALARSNDAWDRAGNNLTTWVQRTCVALVGRQTSNPAPWVALAQRSGRTAAAAAITRTAGFGEYRLALLYKQMLGTTPSAGAKKSYAPRMRTRGDFTMPGVVGSGTAFWNRAQR